MQEEVVQGMRCAMLRSSLSGMFLVARDGDARSISALGEGA
jgi:hypothetical protein